MWGVAMDVKNKTGVTVIYAGFLKKKTTKKQRRTTMARHDNRRESVNMNSITATTMRRETTA